MNKQYDFIVGFTLFTPTGFRTMYRHFDNLEIAEMFASNVNIKDNHKIYVDLDLYQKEKEKNKELKEMLKHRIKYTNELEEDLFQKANNYVISKDKIKEVIKDLEKFNIDFYTKEMLKECFKNSLKELLEE